MALLHSVRKHGGDTSITTVRFKKRDSAHPPHAAPVDATAELQSLVGLVLFSSAYVIPPTPEYVWWKQRSGVHCKVSRRDLKLDRAAVHAMRS